MNSKATTNPHPWPPGASAASPLVVISILNWNGWQDTLECLESVRRLDYPNFLTVVVDNGSWNGSADKIRAWAEANLGPGQVFADYTRETALAGGDPEIEQALDGAASSVRMILIRNEENLGFTGGNNVSIHYGLVRHRASDFVFLLNNDSSVSQDCLRILVSVALRTGAGIAEAAICSEGQTVPSTPWRPPRWQVALERLFGNTLGPFMEGDGFCEVIATRGAAMLAAKDLLLKIHSSWHEYLHEHFFMYAEDVGISLRARALGFRCIRVNGATVWHKGAKSAGGRFNPLEYYYGHRNGLLLAREMSVSGKLIVRFISMPRILGRVARCASRGHWAAAKAIFCGVVDGFRGVAGKWKRHDQEVHMGPGYEG